MRGKRERFSVISGVADTVLGFITMLICHCLWPPGQASSAMKAT